MAEAGEPSDLFVHAITVQWADCDPARIAYTGQIPKFALSAIDAWWAERVGIDWFALNVDHRMGTPFVHLDMDFRSPITPRHPLFCTVMLSKLGTTSLTFRVVGRQDGTVRFEGNFVCVAVSADDFRPGYPSAEIRTRLESLLSERL
ncbi:acyl-CoA thioesterase [Georhizobium profundi]|uniref:Acyl-CoA thioesterase n=1 Tax=Georhizobium profundi TaxID=2341112 RepID=A0A3Q8XNZ4_9HYPH|nr:acyl-CoA thioesterase [Georhizobium profundi]AZN70971.1 acyl-CoA thioesterase [Georhizobium profundi]